MLRAFCSPLAFADNMLLFSINIQNLQQGVVEWASTLEETDMEIMKIGEGEKI